MHPFELSFGAGNKDQAAWCAICCMLRGRARAARAESGINESPAVLCLCFELCFLLWFRGGGKNVENMGWNVGVGAAPPQQMWVWEHMLMCFAPASVVSICSTFLDDALSGGRHDVTRDTPT
jgi:hypothetical protein